MRIVDHASSSHTGKVRRTNEDAFLDQPPLFVVADGMGGARAGELASRLAVDTFRELEPVEGETGEDRLRRTILESNRRVLERAKDDPATAGMGSTVTAALVTGDQVVLGHVGDSRAYLLRDGALQQLSHDHSLVAELERAGRLTREEAAVHPQRSVITRALGAGPELDVDTSVVALREGDVLLLCSDGLSGLVGDLAIANLLGGGGSLADGVRRLVRAANDAGGDDNVTAVAFRIGGDAGELAPPPAAAAPDVSDPDLSDTLTEADAVPALRLPPPERLLAQGPVAPAPARTHLPRARHRSSCSSSCSRSPPWAVCAGRTSSGSIRPRARSPSTRACPSTSTRRTTCTACRRAARCSHRRSRARSG